LHARDRVRIFLDEGSVAKKVVGIVRPTIAFEVGRRRPADFFTALNAFQRRLELLDEGAAAIEVIGSIRPLAAFVNLRAEFLSGGH